MSGRSWLSFLAKGSAAAAVDRVRGVVSRSTQNPPLRKPLVRKPLLPTKDHLPDWGALTARSSAWAARRPGRRGRVLIATNVGGNGPASMMESVLAAALALRDADVEIVLCDGVLPGCLQAEYSVVPDPTVLVRRKLPDRLCPACLLRGRSMFEPLGLKVHYLSQLATEEQREDARRQSASISADEIATYSPHGVAVGEHARAGALRYFSRGDLSGERHGEEVLRRFLEAALVTATAYSRLLAERHFDVAVFHHGLYVPQGLVGEVCRKFDVRVVNWVTAYRANSFILSHGDTYHHTLMDEPVEAWEGMAWSDRQRGEIDAYLKSRRRGHRDWYGFHEKPSEDIAGYAQKVGLDLAKPTIGMLTNVAWDAQLHYPANAFPSQMEWVRQTIEYFFGRPDLQLLIRVHPAEIRGTVPSRQPMVEEIGKRFPVNPPNVFVIPPEIDISTYAAMTLCDSVLIYGTKMGVELTAIGVPTVVAGEAWIKNKGVTFDAASRAEYLAILDRLPLGRRLDPEIVDRAKRYAYHFFFRRMMPLTFMQRDQSRLFCKADIESADDLAPGKNAALDRICEGILDGRPFIYPAEELGVHDA
jgi:hypothetical protein